MSIKSANPTQNAFVVYFSKKDCEDKSNKYCLKVLSMGSSLGSYVKCADDFMKNCEKIIQKQLKLETICNTVESKNE